MTFRVLHVINQMWHSGAETSLRQILTSMHDPTIVHEVLSLDSERNDFAALLDAGIPCGHPRVTLRTRRDRIRFVHAAITVRRPDLVHSTLFEADLASRVAAKLAGRPVLVSLVNSQPLTTRKNSSRKAKIQAVHAVDRALARHATAYFHAITEAVANEASAVYGIDRERIAVIPRGRSLEALGGSPTPQRRTEARRRLGFGDSRLLLHIGRQEPQKGHVYLLQAFERVANTHKDVVLLMAGRNGNATAAINRVLRDLRHADRVHILGQRTDVGDLLNAADLFVFPSLWEGLGGALLEAMAMKVPIVASDIPAICEVLNGGSCGKLVPVSDPNALASSIHVALEDANLRSNYVSQAALRFEDHYKLERCVSRMRAMYHDISSDRKSPLYGSRYPADG